MPQQTDTEFLLDEMAKMTIRVTRLERRMAILVTATRVAGDALVEMQQHDDEIDSIDYEQMTKDFEEHADQALEVVADDTGSIDRIY